MIQDALAPQEIAHATAFFDRLFGMAPARIAAVKLDKQNAVRLSVVALYGRDTVAHDKIRQANGGRPHVGKSYFSFTQDKTYPRLYRLTSPIQAGIVGREVYVAFEGGKDNPVSARNKGTISQSRDYGYGYEGFRF